MFVYRLVLLDISTLKGEVLMQSIMVYYPYSFAVYLVTF